MLHQNVYPFFSKSIIGLIVVLLLSCKVVTKQSESLEYTIETKDIDHFWKAYDALEFSKDSTATFKKIYFDQATPEFKKFIELRNFTPEKYISFIKKKPKFLQSIRPLTERVKTKKEDIEAIYTRMAILYPSFKAPDICFAISPTKTGGTTDKGLILIGTEIAVVDPSVVDISEVDGFLKKVFETSSGNIEDLIAHELVHTQQNTKSIENNSLLSHAIIEGAADFIATKVVGRRTLSKSIFDYGEAHEKVLWSEFMTAVKENKTYENTTWFYDYNAGRPADLGYYIGYKICEAYYKNHSEKNKAIQEIIDMEDAEAFLQKSQYETIKKTDSILVNQSMIFLKNTG